MGRLWHVGVPRAGRRRRSGEVAQGAVLDVAQYRVGAGRRHLATASCVEDELALEVARPPQHGLERLAALAALVVARTCAVHRLLGGEVTLVLGDRRAPDVLV